MFVPVQIKVGDQAAYDRSIELTERQLQAFQHEAGDMTEPLTRIGEDLHTQIGAAFASQGAGGATGRWAVLSDNPPGSGYRSWKQARGPGVPILVGLKPAGTYRGADSLGRRRTRRHYEPSGQMMRQLLMPLADPATWHVSPTRLAYTPTSDIAGYHETGTDRMPPRPPVDLTPRFLHSVDRQFVRWLAAVMKRTGV